MKKTMKLRLIGGVVLMFNVWLIGRYNLGGIPVLLLTFGFAGLYEFLVVRPASKAEEKLVETSIASVKRATPAATQQASQQDAAATSPVHISIDSPLQGKVMHSGVKEKLGAHAVAAVDEELIYTHIADEFEIGIADKGLWTRLFAECDGDEAKTKARYIKHRAGKLISAEKARLDDVARQQAESAAAIKIARYPEIFCGVRAEFPTVNELNAFGINGHTPLMTAILNGDEQRVQALLELGGRTDRYAVIDGKYVSPCELAESAGHVIYELVSAARACETTTEGNCPNCNALIPMASQACPKCIATFGESAAWHVVKHVSHGKCPTCSMVLDIKSLQCPQCKTAFSAKSTWKLIPLG